jgi:mercuric ion binding protein
MMKTLIPIVIVASLLTLPLTAQAATRTVVLSVPTMDCDTCPLIIRTALERVSGVNKAKVSYERREAVVTFDDSHASVAQLVAATTEVGYPSFTR